MSFHLHIDLPGQKNKGSQEIKENTVNHQLRGGRSSAGPWRAGVCKALDSAPYPRTNQQSRTLPSHQDCFLGGFLPVSTFFQSLGTEPSDCSCHLKAGCPDQQQQALDERSEQVIPQSSAMAPLCPCLFLPVQDCRHSPPPSLSQHLLSLA